MTFSRSRASINKYKQRFQLTIHKLRKLGESEIDFADYLPKTTKDVDELWQTLTDFIASSDNPHLKCLVQAFMARSRKLPPRTATPPPRKRCITPTLAACWITSVSLFRSCDLMCKNYPQINRDLLLTGAFLHDIGKIHELTYNRSFSYSTKGQIAGAHDHRTGDAAGQASSLPGFPDELKTMIEHMIISHHGRVRVRITQAADVPRSFDAALS